MSNFKKFLKVHFVFFILYAGSICIYSYLSLQFADEVTSSDIRNFLIPICGVPVLIFFTYGILLRKYSVGFGPLILITCWGSIFLCFAPVIARSYLQTAAGKISQLENISDINEQAPTRYYTLKNFHTNKQFAGTCFIKRGGFWLYCTSPLIENAGDTFEKSVDAWIIKRYDKSFGSHYAGNKEMEDKFWNESIDDFWKADLSKFQYLRRMDDRDESQYFEAAAAASSKFKTSENNIFLEPFDEPFEERNGNKLLWFYFCFFAGLLIFILTINYYVGLLITPAPTEAETKADLEKFIRKLRKEQKRKKE